jgi:hypothetical protein
MTVFGFINRNHAWADKSMLEQAAIMLPTELLAIWVWSTATVAFFKRGALLHVISAEIVDAKGRRAGRGRRLLRSMLPGVLIFFVIVIVNVEGSLGPVTGLVLLGVGIAFWLWSVWKDPGASLLERASGTRLVRA